MESLHDFTKGKILGPLLKFAYPVFLALFLQAMYGAVDLLVVGKFATTADVSGVAVGSGGGVCSETTGGVSVGCSVSAGGVSLGGSSSVPGGCSVS